MNRKGENGKPVLKFKQFAGMVQGNPQANNQRLGKGLTKYNRVIDRWKRRYIGV